MTKNFKPNIKDKCSRKNGNANHNLPNSSNSKASTNKKNSIKSCTKKMSKLESTKKNKENRKGKETEKWLKESLPRKENWLSTKNCSRKRKDKKPKGFWLVSETRAPSWLPTKGNLTDWSKSKGSRRKRNSKKIGKKEKKPDSTYFTKFTTTEKEKWENTKRQRKSNWEKENRTRPKCKEEWENTRPNNKPVVRPNTRDQSRSRRSFSKKLRRSKREEDWFCWSCRGKRTRWRMQDRNTIRRLRSARSREGSSWRTSRKRQDSFDLLFYFIFSKCDWWSEFLLIWWEIYYRLSNVVVL